jgi:hypothetical protein
MKNAFKSHTINVCLIECKVREGEEDEEKSDQLKFNIALLVWA